MKGVRQIFGLMAVGGLVAGGAFAQEQSASFNQARQAYPNARLQLELQREPQLMLGNGTRITGLMVDCLTPQATWTMGSPSVPAQPQLLPAQAVRPVMAPRVFNSNLAVHEPDFTFVRFSFP